MPLVGDKMPDRFNEDGAVPHVTFECSPSPAAILPGPRPPAPRADVPGIPMRLSVPVTDEGVLVAVAAQGLDAGWFLIAIDPRLEALDRAPFGSAREIEAAARAHLRRSRPSPPPLWS